MGAASSCRRGEPGLEVPWRQGQPWLQAAGSLSHWADGALVPGEMGVAGKRALLWPHVTGVARRAPQLSAACPQTLLWRLDPWPPSATHGPWSGA